MKFRQIDKILELNPGQSVRAVKHLTGKESYLQDHFPRFPVMPGVLMVEAMYQASAWLARVTEDFAHSMVTLKEARNVKFAHFVAPGETLEIRSTILNHDDTTTRLKVEGLVAGKKAVTARLVLDRYNLADRHPAKEALDAYIRRRISESYAELEPSAGQTFKEPAGR